MKIELSHDLLAKKIYDKASTEDKMLIKIRNFIKNRFAYFKENKVLLSREDLDYISPYLKQLTLEQHELIFIDRSKQALVLQRAVIIGIAIAVVFVITYFMNKTEQVKVENQELLAKQLLEYKEIEAEAQALSSALVESREGLDATKEELRLALLKLQQKNDTLLHDYASYKVHHDDDKEQLLQELKIAQSSKLSELAAPIVYDNRKYAFQLARKAWELNPENQQAMKVIYQSVDATLETPFSKQKTRNYIKWNAKKWGELSDKKMRAIFNPKNAVVADNKEKKIAEQIEQVTKEPEPPTMNFVPEPQRQQKVQAEINKLQQKLQDQIQQQPPKPKGPINFPK
ncbi:MULTISPECIES: hypothetical protein [unclassified Aureispira]|uniref:hypothetical protein n=1 Tax=unclassified Aureispira TaxID=2649989 RepID=UPI000695AB42|nr:MULTISPECIES: hypothetical protein [unclassified Aureispira]WMX13713.1 hypothetical protein QP953_22940 [Aureispira sp. CCB-E]